MTIPNHTYAQRERRLGRSRALGMLFILVLGVAHGLPACAQTLLTDDEAARASQLFARAAHAGRMACMVDPRMPTMDFNFRFNAGFIVHYPMRQFEGMKAVPRILARVTPQGGEQAIFGEACRLPALPAGIDPGKTVIDCSGGFSVGEGKYLVEVLTFDERERVYQKNWHITAARGHGERQAPQAIAAHTVRALESLRWDGKLDRGPTGIRLTVLLDVAPINPFVFKMRAWDRAFLLSSLASLLQQTPCASVRLIAFSLQQQREIFRQEHFDQSGFDALSRAVGELELGTVSAQTLQRRLGWMDLLTNLSNQEVAAHDPSDFVIFLGPATRTDRKVPPDMLKPRETTNPRFFYFEYYPYWRGGSEFADSIEYLTKARRGAVLKIHSPGELAEAIQKMLKEH